MNKKPLHESLEEHRKHCQAKIECPFEKEMDNADVAVGESTARELLERYERNGLDDELVNRSIDLSEAISAGKERPNRLPAETFREENLFSIPMWVQCAYHLASSSHEDNDGLTYRLLCDFAKSSGAICSETLREDCKKRYGKILASGAESSVFDDGNTVVKVSTLSLGSISLLQKIDRLILGNHYFPSTANFILGFGKEGNDIDEEPAFLLRQTKIRFGEMAMTDQEIRAYLDGKGFELVDEFFHNYASKDNTLACLDMHGENVVRNAVGEVVVIDPCIIPNTYELKFNCPGFHGNYDYDEPPALFNNRHNKEEI